MSRMAHTAAEPAINLMNSRRLIASPETEKVSAYAITLKGAMSAKGQKQTFAVQQPMPAKCQ